MTTFLSCLLSSPRLENLYLSAYPYSYAKGDGFNEWYHADAVLSAVPGLPRMRRIALRNIHVGEYQLAQFCRGLGSSNLEMIDLYDIDLDGSWHPIIDILKEKCSAGPRLRSSVRDDWDRPVPVKGRFAWHIGSNMSDAWGLSARAYGSE